MDLSVIDDECGYVIADTMKLRYNMVASMIRDLYDNNGVQYGVVRLMSIWMQY